MSSGTPVTPTPTPPTTPKKPSIFRVIGSALVEWAESPTGKHTLIAVAAGLGAAVEQAIKAWVH